MACTSIIPSVSKRLVTTVGDTTYQAYTPWMPAIGVDLAKIVLIRKSTSTQPGSTENFTVRPAIQVAAVRTSDPDAWANLGTDTFTGDGEECTGTEFISSTTASEFYVRFGVGYELGGTGGTHGQSDVSMSVSYTTCGRVIGSRTTQLQATSTSTSYEPMTPWVPAIAAERFKAAFVLTGADADFRYRFAFRTAKAITESPEAWDDSLEASWRSPTGGEDEHDTGELTPNGISTDMWVQLGVAYKADASGLVNGTLSGAFAVRRG